MQNDQSLINFKLGVLIVSLKTPKATTKYINNNTRDVLLKTLNIEGLVHKYIIRLIQ